MGVIRWLLRWGFRAGIAILALTIAAVLYFSTENLQRFGLGKVDSVDAILVLGGGVDADGVPSYSSRRRVLGAVRLLNDGKAKALILSGGPENRPEGQRAADLMLAHAVSLGAPAEALIPEPRAVSTFENLRFGFALADERGFARLAILTDAFHLERARHLAAYFGRPDVVPVAVDGLRADTLPHRVWSIIREALAWWLNLAKVGAWEAMALAGVDADTRAELVR